MTRRVVYGHPERPAKLDHMNALVESFNRLFELDPQAMVAEVPPRRARSGDR